MDETDPRRDLDKLTRAIIVSLADALEVTIKELVSLGPDLALAQLNVLGQRAMHRIKRMAFEMETDLSRLGLSDLSEEDVLQVTRVTVAVVEQAIDNARRHVEDCARDVYGDDDEPDLPE